MNFLADCIGISLMIFNRIYNGDLLNRELKMLKKKFDRKRKVVNELKLLEEDFVLMNHSN